MFECKDFWRKSSCIIKSVQTYVETTERAPSRINLKKLPYVMILLSMRSDLRGAVIRFIWIPGNIGVDGNVVVKYCKAEITKE